MFCRTYFKNYPENIQNEWKHSKWVPSYDFRSVSVSYENTIKIIKSNFMCHISNKALVIHFISASKVYCTCIVCFVSKEPKIKIYVLWFIDYGIAICHI